MNRYEDVCATYAKVRGDFDTNREKCFAFIEELMDGLAVSLGCQRHHVKLGPPNTNYEPGRNWTIPEAVKAGFDGAFHFRLGVTVYAEPDNPPAETVIFDMAVFWAPAGYEIRLGGTHEPYRIPPNYQGVTAKHEAFFENVYRRLKATYTRGVERFEDKPDAARTIGM